MPSYWLKVTRGIQRRKMDPPRSQVLLRRLVLERLLNKLQYVVSHSASGLDLDYLHFICTHEVILIDALEEQNVVPDCIVNALRELCTMVRGQVENETLQIELEAVAGVMGRPKYIIEKEKLRSLLDIQLPIPCIAKLLGVSERTVFRRMMEFELSVSDSYSTLSDQELDMLVSNIKSEMPHVGYRLMMGRLRSLGHRIQWSRLRASMHRIDAVGVFSSMTQLGCIVRRKYSVRAPLSLVHVDTNHKLIRYNLVIFRGIDGFSRKIMYLDASNNNKASTGFTFFLDSIEQNGLPSRVRADQGVENLDIARFMFTVRGTDRASFISGKSVHNQRIERLWRDVWTAVTVTYYDVLHSLEEDGLLDISSALHIFLVHFVFLPRLRKDLQTFAEGWNHHPLRTERNMSPQQLWEVGLLQNSTHEPENVEGEEDFDIDWESAIFHEESLTECGVVIPELSPSLNEQEMQHLQASVDPTATSYSHGRDIFVQCLNIFS
ncbi:uncharacterized protein LOC130570501 [Triplophysa rosa]|uniref:uncharacterized protein LOC130570501 n=1 Tax=Triplophysa rosa TaxID=992332 RepID=UPI0025461939|nr:uncharacterized protein LOC130570501 [Triplophysa rosa]